MTELDLDAIKARLNATAPGPWEVYNPNGSDHGALWSVANDGYHNPTESGDDAFGLYLDCGGIEDAEFIAHAREDVPALLAEIARLKAANANLINNANVLAGELVAREFARDAAAGPIAQHELHQQGCSAMGHPMAAYDRSRNASTCRCGEAWMAGDYRASVTA